MFNDHKNSSKYLISIYGSGMSLELVGLFIALSYICGGLSHRVIHRIFHRKFHVKGFALASLLLMLVTGSIGYVQNEWITGSLVALHFFIYGSYGLWRKSIKHDILPRDKMPDYINLGGLLFQLSIIPAMLIGCFVINKFNMSTTFYISSPIALVSGLLSLFFVYKNLEQDVNEYLDKKNNQNNY